MKITFTSVLLAVVVLLILWLLWRQYSPKQVLDQKALDEDAACKLRDAELLKKLQAVTAVTDQESNNQAIAVLDEIMDIYGSTLRWPHTLYADFERVCELVYTWEKDNVVLDDKA